MMSFHDFSIALSCKFQVMSSKQFTIYGIEPYSFFCIFHTFYSKLKVETIIDESNIDDILKSIYIRIISSVEKFIG